VQFASKAAGNTAVAAGDTTGVETAAPLAVTEALEIAAPEIGALLVEIEPVQTVSRPAQIAAVGIAIGVDDADVVAVDAAVVCRIPSSRHPGPLPAMPTRQSDRSKMSAKNWTLLPLRRSTRRRLAMI
jgi:hypothetical protein